jgi:hypothetical protein
MENDDCKLCSDPILLWDRSVRNNLPYIRQSDTINHKAAFTDITIPLIQNLQATNAQKQYKYQIMTFKTNKQWQQNETFVIPPVLSAVGVVRNRLNKSLTIVDLQQRIISQDSILFHREKIPQWWRPLKRQKILSLFCNFLALYTHFNSHNILQYLMKWPVLWLLSNSARSLRPPRKKITI